METQQGEESSILFENHIQWFISSMFGFCHTPRASHFELLAWGKLFVKASNEITFYLTYKMIPSPSKDRNVIGFLHDVLPFPLVLK